MFIKELYTQIVEQRKIDGREHPDKDALEVHLAGIGRRNSTDVINYIEGKTFDIAVAAKQLFQARVIKLSAIKF